MLVQCDHCRFRFQVPDEKVGPEGGRVRCTQCHNAFRVKKAPAGVAPAGQPNPFEGTEETAQDPFASFRSILSISPGALEPITAPMELTARVSSSKAGLDRSLFGDPFASLSDEVTRLEPPPIPPRPESPPKPEPKLQPDKPEPEPAEEDVPHWSDVPPPLPPQVPDPASIADTRPRFELNLPPNTALLDVEAPSPTQTMAKPLRAPLAPAPTQPLRPVRSARDWSWTLFFSVLLALAAVLFGWIYQHGGRWQAALVPSGAERAHGSRRWLAVVDSSSGVYDTDNGKQLFYVRGEVENRGEQKSKALVKVEILDGAQLVRASEQWAGTLATPEDLYRVSGPDDLNALSSRLRAGAVVLAPGQRAPFLVIFNEFPPDLSAYQLSLTVNQ